MKNTIKFFIKILVVRVLVGAILEVNEKIEILENDILKGDR